MNTDVQRIESKADKLVATAKGLVVTDAESYQVAGEFLLLVKDYRGQVAAAFDPTVKATRDAWQIALAERKRHDGPADEAETIANQIMGAWHREEQARLQRIADEEAAEQRRIAEAEAAERRRIAEEKQLAAAARAEEAGQHEKAESILSRPTPVAPVSVAPTPVAQAAPKIEGLQRRTTWGYEITDEDALPREFLTPDRKKIGQHVRAHKAKTDVPGLRAVENTGLARGR